MRVDRISYKKIFPLGSFFNETIGVEIQVDETDDWEETFALAKTMVEKFHKDNNPQPDDKNMNLSTSAGLGTTNWSFPSPTAAIPTVDRKATERLEILIDDAKSIEELRLLRDDAERMGLREYWSMKIQNLKQ